VEFHNSWLFQPKALESRGRFLEAKQEQKSGHDFLTRASATASSDSEDVSTLHCCRLRSAHQAHRPCGRVLSDLMAKDAAISTLMGNSDMDARGRR
jgi:hypothetical protein